MNSDTPCLGGSNLSTALSTCKYVLTAILLISAFNAQAQCVSLNEDDFEPLTIQADESNPNPAPVTSNCLDFYDLNFQSPGTDGVGDVEITMTAAVFNPNADGLCNDGDFFVSGAIGGAALPSPGPNSSSDFGGSTNNDCVCTSGYTCFTYTFKNGFDADPSSLDIPFSSGNGSTEAHEALIGFVTQATTNSGGAVSLANVDLSLLETYCFDDYNSGVSISSHIGATGDGVFAVDDPTGNGVDCGDGIEEPDSGSGPNSTSTSQAISNNWGLNPGERVKEFSICWILTNASGDDCDMNGETLVNSNPSASIGEMTICPPPTDFCGLLPAYVFQLDCGDVFNIIIGVEDRLIQGAQVIQFYHSTTEFGPLIPITGTEGLPADGLSEFWIHVANDTDPDCVSSHGPFLAPAPNPPSCGTFPANPAGN